MQEHHIDPAMVSRAQGCLLGQLAGDALGSMVEFRRPEDIRREDPDRIRELADGGRWNTIAGQPTDDSEMALMLARMLAEQGKYDAEEARKAYRLLVGLRSLRLWQYRLRRSSWPTQFRQPSQRSVDADQPAGYLRSEL